MPRVPARQSLWLPLVWVLTGLLHPSGAGPCQAQGEPAQAPSPPSADVEFYMVGKARVYRQPLTGLPVLESEPYRFLALVEPESSGAVTGASLTLPSGTVLTLTNDDDHFRLERKFNDTALLDATFSSGLYTFRIKTVHDGTKRPSLNLPPDAYPSTPSIANLADAQNIEASAEFVLVWTPFKTGTTSDYIRLRIEDDQGDQVIDTPSLLDEGALNGTQASWLIPANILLPNRTYSGRLSFAKLTSVNTTNYPGVPGVTAYFKETRFTLATASNAPAAGRFVFSASTSSVTETQQTVSVTVLRAGGSEGPASVRVATQNSTATAGSDYTSFAQDVGFLAGETSRSFTIPILDDTLLEGTETFRLLLSDPTGGAVIGNPSNAVVRILDNEDARAGAFEFKKATYTVGETSGVALVRVIRFGGTNLGASVTAATVGGSAQAGEDYTAISTNLPFAPGVTNALLLVPITDDSTGETAETVDLRLSHPTGGASLGLRTNAVLTILNDDSGGVIEFAGTNFVANEAGGIAEVAVVRRQGQAEGVTVYFETSDLTASNRVDYLATSQLLFFGAGVRTQIVSVPLINNDVADGTRLVGLRLSNPTGGATLGPTAQAVLTILNDETGVQFRRAAYTNAEGIGLALLTAERVGSTNDAVTAEYTTQDGTGRAGQDYMARAGTLTFLPGVTKYVIGVTLLDDTLAEGPETFQVCFTNVVGNNALLGARSCAEVTIADDDQGGVIQFTTKNFYVSESAKWALVTVSRTNGQASAVTVQYETTATGTARPGIDFMPTNGTLAFDAGVLVSSFKVKVYDNTDLTASRTVGLMLNDPQGGASLGRPTNAVLNILNDDASIEGVYQLVSIPITSSCGSAPTVQGRFILTNQAGGRFTGYGLFFNGGYDGASTSVLSGNLGAGGAIFGTFTNTSGDYGAFNGSAANGRLQASIQGRDRSGTCTISGTISGNLYAPPSSGYAPATLGGRSLRVSSGGFAFRVQFNANDTYQSYEGGTLTDSGIYLYTKSTSNPNAGTLLLSDDIGENITVTFTFTSASGGTFVERSPDGSTSSGTFTL